MNPATGKPGYRFIDADHKTKNSGQATARLPDTPPLSIFDLDKSVMLRVADRTAELRYLLPVLQGAIDPQRTAPFIALFTDRRFQSALRDAGALKEALLFSVLGEQHRAYDQRGLTKAGRCERLHQAKFMLQCLFEESIYKVVATQPQVSVLCLWVRRLSRKISCTALAQVLEGFVKLKPHP